MKVLKHRKFAYYAGREDPLTPEEETEYYGTLLYRHKLTTLVPLEFSKLEDQQLVSHSWK